MMSTDTMAMPAAADDATAGLHSPPDSNPAIKDGASDSELSDLEPDMEASDILEVEPDHVSEGNVPVFKPTMEEFADFTRYVSILGTTTACTFRCNNSP